MSAFLPVTFPVAAADVHTSDWLVSLLLPAGTDRERLMQEMGEQGIETRPTFYCAHTMPMSLRHESFPVAQDIAARGLSLPSYPLLNDKDVARVVDRPSTAPTRCVVTALAKALQTQGLLR